MYKDLIITAVVPAHNEEALIGKTIKGMPELIDHIVVVDDASTDETSRQVTETDDPRVVLIRHETNTGVGGAIVDGHRAALDLGSEVNVVMAATPRWIPTTCRPCSTRSPTTDTGSPRPTGSSRGRPWPGCRSARLLGSTVLSFATKLASGYWNLFDPQNGYTAVTREALSRIDLRRLASGYAFENDLLIWLNIAGVRAKDVPVPAVYGDEVSGMRLHKVIPQIGRLLLVGFWRRMMRKYVVPSFSPVALMLFTGLLLCAVGIVIGIWVSLHSLGEATASAGSVLLAVGPLLVGINMLVHALTLDIQSTPD
ncbi:glycosyltransferase family 2 protein [Actinomadura madurae]|uniref:glycosyltransferase family 2 protein n=1 Tax=Actinomadura madurae TaxID=1993 RepID=UPI0020D21AFF|nr:glycosyltransferase family 2 protein [Actinomadura madurae]MCQ0015623.1 glycosyltransferase family 2 protein [Actinomadura madurae]